MGILQITNITAADAGVYACQARFENTADILEKAVTVAVNTGNNLLSGGFQLIMKTCLFKYTENFTTKKWKFSDEKFLYFIYIWSKHRRGGSNEYPQSMFFSRNKKNNVYSGKPQFYYIKVGFKGVKII